MQETAKKQIINSLTSIKFGKPITHGNITIIPILQENETKPEYMLIKEAVEKGLAEIVETGEIGTLKVLNHGETPILIPLGEELTGETQSRTVNTSILIGPKEEIEIPVSCIERRRPLTINTRIKSRKYTLPEIRREIILTKNTETHYANQHILWDTVHHYLTMLKAEKLTKTEKHEAIWKKLEEQKEKIKEIKRKLLKTKPNQIGAIFLINGEPFAIEFFDNPETWRKTYERILDGYIAHTQTIKQKKTQNNQRTNKIIKTIQENIHSVKIQKMRKIGIGENYKIKTNKYTGETLTHKNKIIHTILIFKLPKNSNIKESLRLIKEVA